MPTGGLSGIRREAVGRSRRQCVLGTPPASARWEGGGLWLGLGPREGGREGTPTAERGLWAARSTRDICIIRVDVWG